MMRHLNNLDYIFFENSVSLDPIYPCLAGTSLTVTTLKVKGQMFEIINQIIYFKPKVNLFTMNSIEIIHAYEKWGKRGM